MQHQRNPRYLKATDRQTRKSAPEPKQFEDDDVCVQNDGQDGQAERSYSVVDSEEDREICQEGEGCAIIDAYQADWEIVNEQSYKEQDEEVLRCGRSSSDFECAKNREKEGYMGRSLKSKSYKRVISWGTKLVTSIFKNASIWTFDMNVYNNLCLIKYY